MNNDLDILDDLERLEKDPGARMIIRTGQTIGCFYIESPAMRGLFARMKCESYRDVVAASSIIRPGVAESGMMQEFLRRYRNPDRGRDESPQMRRLLDETFGIMIYQEDVIKVAHEIGGLTLADADLMRRAMSGKTRGHENLKELADRFKDSCLRKGIDDEEAEEIWRQIESFSGYSFCKGHSAAFAVLSFQVAWLKAHYPAEFLAAVISNGGGFYSAGAYVSEAWRMGLRVLQPSVNESLADCTAKTEMELNPDNPTEGERSKAQGWIRIGLRNIKNMSEVMIQRILDARKEGGGFQSLKEFISRTKCGYEICSYIIKAGGFDDININRSEILIELDIIDKKLNKLDLID
ncbi:MAG: hypothetical protein NTX50_06395 [Candidatus Sumerlaeota bacterium]|nr:hypothetical protein [Candidatus Sumerlaeota bacterium]